MTEYSQHQRFGRNKVVSEPQRSELTHDAHQNQLHKCVRYYLKYWHEKRPSEPLAVLSLLSLITKPLLHSKKHGSYYTEFFSLLQKSRIIEKHRTREQFDDMLRFADLGNVLQFDDPRRLEQCHFNCNRFIDAIDRLFKLDPDMKGFEIKQGDRGKVIVFPTVLSERLMKATDNDVFRKFRMENSASSSRQISHHQHRIRDPLSGGSRIRQKEGGGKSRSNQRLKTRPAAPYIIPSNQVPSISIPSPTISIFSPTLTPLSPTLSTASLSSISSSASSLFSSGSTGKVERELLIYMKERLLEDHQRLEKLRHELKLYDDVNLLKNICRSSFDDRRKRDALELLAASLVLNQKGQK